MCVSYTYLVRCINYCFAHYTPNLSLMHGAHTLVYTAFTCGDCPAPDDCGYDEHNAEINLFMVMAMTGQRANLHQLQAIGNPSVYQVRPRAHRFARKRQPYCATVPTSGLHLLATLQYTTCTKTWAHSEQQFYAMVLYNNSYFQAWFPLK